MNAPKPKTLSVFAPAKINLFLHVTGQLQNRYHSLESLITFADIGDRIDFDPTPEFAFEITGPYAGSFQNTDQGAGEDSTNLVVRALRKVSGHVKKPLDFRVTLTKNLPLASGLGGGSADAAAAIWGALKYWDMIPARYDLAPLLRALGADVPVCFAGTTQHVSGIGDVLRPIAELAEIPIVLVNPGKPCPTQDVFMRFKKPFHETVELPDDLSSAGVLIDFLRAQGNDLDEAAIQIVPDIENVMRSLSAEKSCFLARLSGSGATCFGLFEHEIMAKLAAQNIKKNNPDWWVRQGWIGRTGRY